MNTPLLVKQQRASYICSVWTPDAVNRTCQEQWAIGSDEERQSEWCSKFLQSSSYSNVINCTFTFCTSNFFGCFHGIIAHFELVKYKFRMRLHHTLILASFKSYAECDNECVSTSTTTMLPIIAGTFHSLTCFSHLIYASQSCIYQNKAKTLTYPNRMMTVLLYCLFREKSRKIDLMWWVIA